ncbi:hypothetical protein J2Z30_003366 [Streptomyces iranensis]|nr:hypothetical protein [Streptomyces iranensis]
MPDEWTSTRKLLAGQLISTIMPGGRQSVFLGLAAALCRCKRLPDLTM